MSSVRHSKNPQWLSKLSMLKPGDILLFGPVLAHDSLGSSLLKLGIELVSYSHLGAAFGHSTTTHAAIVVENKEENPVIAHLTGGEIMGYEKIKLIEKLSRDGGDRHFSTFRAHEVKIQEQLAKIAGDEKEHQHVSWSKLKAAKSALIPDATLDPARVVKETEITENEICSSFVIKVMKLAAIKVFGDIQFSPYRPNILSSATPKNIEDELFKNPEYDLLIYTGLKNPFQFLTQLIQDETLRLRTGIFKNINRANAIEEAFQKIPEDLRNEENNDFIKARKLLYQIIPSLQSWPKKREIVLGTTASYTHIINSIAAIGIYVRDLTIFGHKPDDKLKVHHVHPSRIVNLHLRPGTPLDSTRVRTVPGITFSFSKSMKREEEIPSELVDSDKLKSTIHL